MSQEETVEMLEQFLAYAKAGFVSVREIERRSGGDGFHPDETKITLCRTIPMPFVPCPKPEADEIEEDYEVWG
jgi:hypothetical protein